MVKIIIASHLNMAGGLKDTLEYILPEHVDIQVINAYTTNVPVEAELEEKLNAASDADQILIFTDLSGGSVNQAATRYLAGNPNIHLVSGMNLPLVLTLAMAASAGSLDAEGVRHAIEEARNQIVYINDVLADAALDEEDE